MGFRVKRTVSGTLLVVLSLFAITLMGCGGGDAADTDTEPTDTEERTSLPGESASGDAMAATGEVCIVCGQSHDSPMTVAYDGKNYTVCSEACQQKFEASPAEFAMSEGAEAPSTN